MVVICIVAQYNLIPWIVRLNSMCVYHFLIAVYSSKFNILRDPFTFCKLLHCNGSNMYDWFCHLPCCGKLLDQCEENLCAVFICTLTACALLCDRVWHLDYFS